MFSYILMVYGSFYVIFILFFILSNQYHLMFTVIIVMIWLHSQPAITWDRK